MLKDETVKEICEAIIDGTYKPADSIEARHNFVGVFEVINGNPNGDPATGKENLPRTNPVNGEGEVSGICLKRKTRETIKLRHGDEEGYDMYCERGSNVSDTQDAVREQVERVFDVICEERGIQNKGKDKAKEKLWKRVSREMLLTCLSETFFDVRMYGCVATRLMKTAAGDKNAPAQIKGPIQIPKAMSCDPVVIEQDMIAPTFGNKEDKDRNFGSHAMIPYGLYVFHVDVAPTVARNTRMTKKDFELFVDSLKWMFELDTSFMRGEQNLLALYEFEHGGAEARFGAQPRRELYDALKITKVCDGIPSSREDYKIEFDDSGICDKVTVRRLI